MDQNCFGHKRFQDKIGENKTQVERVQLGKTLDRNKCGSVKGGGEGGGGIILRKACILNLSLLWSLEPFKKFVVVVGGGWEWF